MIYTQNGFVIEVSMSEDNKLFCIIINDGNNRKFFWLDEENRIALISALMMISTK